MADKDGRLRWVFLLIAVVLFILGFLDSYGWLIHVHHENTLIFAGLAFFAASGLV